MKDSPTGFLMQARVAVRTLQVKYKGEVVEHGPASDIFRTPQHDYTKALFDAAPGREFEFGRFEAV